MTSPEKPIQWWRVLLLIVRLAVISVVFISLRDWSVALAPEYEPILRKGSGFIYIIILLLFVAKPLLEAVGQKVDPLPWERKR